jgi:hypothetical protein
MDGWSQGAGNTHFLESCTSLEVCGVVGSLVMSVLWGCLVICHAFILCGVDENDEEKSGHYIIDKAAALPVGSQYTLRLTANVTL